MKFYSLGEERLNIFSHAFGLMLSCVGLVLLILRATSQGTLWHVLGFSVFGVSLIMLYAASTIYHTTQTPQRRIRWRVVDHAAIYILIAGTYTPFMLTTLRGSLGWTLLAVTWGMALLGIVLKLFFTGRFTVVSTLMYVFMGWLIMFAIKPMAVALPEAGIYWLIAGGISYTVGAILYAIKAIPYNHAIFHFFVLFGSFSHFMAVYGYIIH
ncbi:PAQR family membrane homeostasis protein TrhA [Marinicella gelatinilytica]|uniref:PAQR family membrane homeostasis protein TrhA n=1 Tax=Marinicella gelatinilytica TaxID=2996017 RepID=UPI002260FA3D|nr:hemolysin III family protein [Marinicella gelatinilytica]MCX7544528.1 hemolysin III family protein [Marinicella gelatinilytica]